MSFRVETFYQISADGKKMLVKMQKEYAVIDLPAANLPAGKIELKDNAGAANDFRIALRYVPYDQQAKDGLKKIGVAQ